MHSFGFEYLAMWAHRNPRKTLLVAGVLTLGLGWAATGVKLEESVSNLRSPNNQGINTSMEIGKTFGASFTYMMALVDGRSPEEVDQASRQVLNVVQPFIASKQVLFTDSLDRYLPPLTDQEAVIARLKADPEGAFDYVRIRKTFQEACRKNGFSEDYFNPYLEVLERMLAPQKPVTYAQLAEGPLGPILRKFIVQKGPDDVPRRRLSLRAGELQGLRTHRPGEGGHGGRARFEAGGNQPPEPHAQAAGGQGRLPGFRPGDHCGLHHHHLGLPAPDAVPVFAAAAVPGPDLDAGDPQSHECPPQHDERCSSRP